MSRNYYTVACILLLLVSSLVKVDCLYEEERSYENRLKRQQEYWSWGYTDDAPQNNTTPIPTQAPSESPVPEDPCAPYEPAIPNFTAPGRKISETKCYEYIWNNHFRDIEEKRNTACRNRRKKHPSHAVGGRNTKPTEFPHMGALGWKTATDNWLFLCGSSLISRNFVLTAAHCSSISPRDTRVTDTVPKIVRFRNKNLFKHGRNPPIDINIKRIIVHPSYKPPRRYYDIALMELEQEVKFDKNLQPACVWSKFDTSELGTRVTLTGWGVKEENSRDISPELQAADVDVIDSQTCNHLLRSSYDRNWYGVEDHQLCAGKLAGGVDACQGDSGGPLQVKIPLPTTEQGSMHYVIGVTAFGIGCARENKPGLYTRVSSFIDWIDDNVWR